MQKNTEPCYYPDYLQLDKLLDSQKPVSGQYGEEAHDETLFIIVHQAYELWFKQIRHEIYSLLEIFKENPVDETKVSLALSRVYRINSIVKILIDQLTVMETMLPQNFLDFRDYLVPASGFQSWQFREIEIRLGLKSKNRVKFDQSSFFNRLKEKERDYLAKVEEETSLYELIGQWLERLPFLQFGDFNFWSEYGKSVEQMLKSDEKIIRNNPSLNTEEIEAQILQLENTRLTFNSLLDENLYKKNLSKSHRLGQKAILAAVFIKLYSSRPLLNVPARFLTSLVDLDELITTWRYRHSLMAHRMLGSKIGTGGSAGHNYLKATTHSNRIFTDLFNISTFLIPKSSLPVLPDDLEKKLNFS